MSINIIIKKKFSEKNKSSDSPVISDAKVINVVCLFFVFFGGVSYFGTTGIKL